LTAIATTLGVTSCMP
nr:smalltalk protein [Segatella copri]